MATTHKPYSQFVLRQMNGAAIDWDAATVKVAAILAAYTPNLDTHDFRDDLGANEVPATGNYPAGGLAVPTRAVSFDAATRQVRLTAAAIAANPITIAAFRHLVFYVALGGASSADPLISIVTFDVDQSVDGALTLTPDATGVLRFTVPA